MKNGALGIIVFLTLTVLYLASTGSNDKACTSEVSSTSALTEKLQDAKALLSKQQKEIVKLRAALSKKDGQQQQQQSSPSSSLVSSNTVNNKVRPAKTTKAVADVPSLASGDTKFKGNSFDGYREASTSDILSRVDHTSTGIFIRDLVQTTYHDRELGMSSTYLRYFGADNGVDGDLNTFVKTASDGLNNQRWEMYLPHALAGVQCVALYARHDGAASDFTDMQIHFLSTNSHISWSSPILNPDAQSAQSVLRVPLGRSATATIVQVTRAQNQHVEFGELQFFSNAKCSGEAMNVDFAKFRRMREATQRLDVAVGNITYHCRNTQLLGGGGLQGDGQWPVCFDVPLPEKCTVFSVGSFNEFSFDDAIAGKGCNVATFDPTLKWPKHKVMRGPRIGKYGLGITGDRELAKTSQGKYLTLQGLMEVSGFERLSILKMDVEGHEWKAMKDILEVSKAGLIDQFMFEIHFQPADPTEEQLHFWMKAFEELTEHYEVFYSHPNMLSTVTWMPHSSLCCLEIAYIRKGLVKGITRPPLNKQFVSPQLSVGSNKQYMTMPSMDVLSPTFGTPIPVEFVWQSARWATERAIYFHPDFMIDNDLNSYTLSTGKQDWFELKLARSMRISDEQGENDIACIKLYNRRDRDLHVFTGYRIRLQDANRTSSYIYEDLRSQKGPVQTLNLLVNAKHKDKEFSIIRIEKNGYLQGAEIQLLTDPKCNIARPLDSKQYMAWKSASTAVKDKITTVSYNCMNSKFVGPTSEFPVCFDAEHKPTDAEPVASPAKGAVLEKTLSAADPNSWKEAKKELFQAADVVSQVQLQVDISASSPTGTYMHVDWFSEVLEKYDVFYASSSSTMKVRAMPMNTLVQWNIGLIPRDKN